MDSSFEGALDDILRLLDGRSHRIVCTLGRRLGAEEGLVLAHEVRSSRLIVWAVLGRLFWSLGGSLCGQGSIWALSGCDHELASA